MGAFSPSPLRGEGWGEGESSPFAHEAPVVSPHPLAPPATPSRPSTCVLGRCAVLGRCVLREGRRAVRHRGPGASRTSSQRCSGSIPEGPRAPRTGAGSASEGRGPGVRAGAGSARSGAPWMGRSSRSGRRPGSWRLSWPGTCRTVGEAAPEPRTNTGTGRRAGAPQGKVTSLGTLGRFRCPSQQRRSALWVGSIPGGKHGGPER